MKKDLLSISTSLDPEKEKYNNEQITGEVPDKEECRILVWTRFLYFSGIFHDQLTALSSSAPLGDDAINKEPVYGIMYWFMSVNPLFSN
jgi:hypothetical protein